MAENLSTGFVDAVNVTGSVKTVMTNSVIRIFSGTKPADADTDEGAGVLLMELTESGGAFVSGSAANGLNMGLSSGGVLAKDTTETWQGLGESGAGSGGLTATWFRWYANTVVTGASTVAVRIDGTCSTSSTAELQMTNTLITENGPGTVNNFNFTLPMA